MTKFMQHTKGEMAQWEDTQAKGISEDSGIPAPPHL